MGEEPRVRVTDKRGANKEPRSSGAPERPAVEEENTGQADADGAPEDPSSAPEPEVRVIEVNKDYLEDLKRLQAEFDNYRKRMMKQQADTAASATSGLMKKLLPVLDHFQLAVEHGQANSGVDLAIKELLEVLASEGLEEIEAERQPFDPQMHEAVESHEDAGVEVETVTKVHRRGYTFKGQLLRAPYVVVARPADDKA